MTEPTCQQASHRCPQSRYVLPSFVERTNYGIKESNPYNKLFEERIIFLGAPIDDVVANDVMAQLIVLESTDPDRDIQIYINSPGGSFTALTAIYDTMQYVRPEIQTICMGQAASAAAVLLAAGHQGQAVRPAELPHPDPPALRRGPGPGLRPGDPGQRDPADARPARGDPGPAHRPDRREGPRRHRARHDPHRRAGQGVRHRRRGHHHPQARSGRSERRRRPRLGRARRVRRYTADFRRFCG